MPGFDSLTWWMCSMHAPASQHSVYYQDAVGVAARLTSDGQIPLTATIAAGQKTCVERAVLAGDVDERRVVPADRIMQKVRQ